MTSWDVVMPEMDLQGEILTPAEQEEMAEWAEAVLALCQAQGCTCEEMHLVVREDIVDSRKIIGLIVEHEERCPLG